MSNRQRAVARKRRTRQRNLLVTVVSLVVIGALALALALNRGSDDQVTTTAQTRPVHVTGDPLPELGSGPDAAAGSTIPSITGTGLDGKPFSVTNDGKAKVLLFVAHWCPHCRKEVPLLAGDLRRQSLPTGVELVTVSTGVKPNAPNYPPSTWLADEHWPTRVLADDTGGSAAAAFGLPGYPYFVFVDAQNRVVARASGEMSLTDFRAHVAAISTAT